MNQELPLDLFLDSAVQALRQVSLACGPALPRAVVLLRGTQGVLYCSGCGKSAFVAMKLASSLASLGRVAHFLDPCAASHGEASMLRAEDLLVTVSHSGESDELLELALGAPCPVLALCGRPDSRLGRAARLVLPTGLVQDPSPGVPTSSHLAASFVADLLVAGATLCPDGSLARPQRHPAGAIGRAQRILVEQVMREPPTLTPETSVTEVLRLLTARPLGAVLIVDNKRLTGILTDGDLRRAVERLGPLVFERRAVELATLSPVVVRSDATVGQALEIMERRPSQISVLPVVDPAGELVGLVRIHDLVLAGMPPETP